MSRIVSKNVELVAERNDGIKVDKDFNIAD